ncbi:unnamed protein product [Macrosiphum euphorbiae]|nr:unnamed protein product [Macrosiphum euphorbiae]
MNGYSVEQRVRIIKFYYQNQCSVSETFRALLDFYPRILRRDLGLHPYEIQLTQGLKVNDHTQRRVFADWVLGQLAVDPNFAKKIIFSDEAHFWMNGYVNKQNCRIWDDTNPHKTQKNKMHPEEITVWCGFWSGGIIGPYFFQNETGIAITVNGERYRSMINNFFWPKLYDMDTEDMWFQQDGATCHTARATMDILRERFEGMVISRNGDINWPPRSCDLTPLDFFLWGYLKSHVHANKQQSIYALKVNIINTIKQIQPDLCNKVIENWTTRIRATNQSRGGHLKDVIFHK